MSKKLRRLKRALRRQTKREERAERRLTETLVVAAVKSKLLRDEPEKWEPKSFETVFTSEKFNLTVKEPRFHYQVIGWGGEGGEGKSS